MESFTFLSGEMMKTYNNADKKWQQNGQKGILTALQVTGRPALSFSSGSTMPNLTANSRLGSDIIG